MEGYVLLVTAGLSMLPISELRGAIPYAYYQGVPLLQAYLFSVACNALVAPLVYIFLSTVHRWFMHISLYRSFFHATVERAREKVQEKVNRYGYLGLMLFVAIPLPITGAYTGTLGAWVLGLDRRKTCLAAVGGVVISGIIVSLVLHFGIQPLLIFIKELH